MRGTWKQKLCFLSLFILMAGFLFPQSYSNRPLPLRPGRSYESTVELDETNFGYRSFVLETNDDTFALRLSLEDAPADLDLYIRYKEEIESYSQVDASSTSRVYNEDLFISRLSSTPLRSGTYYVDVAYQGGQAPMKGWKSLQEIPFRITMETISSASNRRIETDTSVYGELLPREGMAKTFSVRLPDGVSECRVDLFETKADLDLLIAYDNPVPDRSNAAYILETVLGNESLVLDGSEGEPELPEGDYYITVFDPSGSEFPQSFGLRVSLQSNPPGELLSIPRFPRSDDELERAIHSTVEIVGELGRGSGCFVSPDGLLLTSWHVIRGFSGEPSERIVVAPSFSSRDTPMELFQARVVEYDRDLDMALLEIESGLYGQRIPYDYEFPFFSLGDSQELQMGQPVSMLGYPGAGQAHSRASVSLSRAIIGGFEKLGGTSYIKTDGAVLAGSSGGAVFNAYFELLGVISFNVGSQESGLGYIFPVSAIPETWLETINRRKGF